jgi:peptide/nickel transport system ATP-binding protein
MIRLENVKMYFRSKKGLFSSMEVKAVDGVSLDIGKGRTLSLVGESGSGKTTLGRLTLRLLQPSSGHIYFEDIDITELDERNLKSIRRRAQAVFQDPYSSIDPFMTVFQIIEEPLLIHKIGDKVERKNRVYNTLQEVRLTPPDEFGEKYPHMLSGGQRQRVGIARALILEPDYILADEPVSMIDASSRVEILHLLSKLQKKHEISFLYITHDIATAKYFSDMIAVMYCGRIVELGTPDKVVKNPLHPYTARLIAAVPEPDASNRFRKRGIVEGEAPNAFNLPSGCSFEPRCSISNDTECRNKPPSLVEMKSNHYVACYYGKKDKP